MKLFCRFGLILAVIYSVSVECVCSSDSKPIRRADSLPDTTPWDLEALSKSPEFEWAQGKAVRSLYYKSEPYKGKTTRVFAYYASPGTLAGDPTQDKNLPGIVLVHGGSGFAFREWTELWAKRGYAAIAMDLCGYGPDRKRLANGGPSGSHYLNNGAPLAKIMTPEIGIRNVAATVEITKQLVSARLYYTSDSHLGITSYDRSKGGQEWEANRTWIERSATIDHEVITAERPPTNATAWFLTVTDDRNSMVSSEIMLPQEEDRKTLNTAMLVDSFVQEIPLVYDVEHTGASFPTPVLPSLSELPAVSPLPDPFEWSNGRGRDTSFESWSHRRAEIKAEIEQYEIGTKPVRPEMMTASIYLGG